MTDSRSQIRFRYSPSHLPSYIRHLPLKIDVHPMFIRWDCLIFPTLIPLSIRALHAHIDNRKAVSARRLRLSECRAKLALAMPSVSKLEHRSWSSGWRIYLSPLRRIAQTFVLRLHHRPASLPLRLRLPPTRKRGSLPLKPRVFPMV